MKYWHFIETNSKNQLLIDALKCVQELQNNGHNSWLKFATNIKNSFTRSANDNSIHNWIGNFLQHRQQRVVVEGHYSASVHVDSGVPQGTVLGPLLFLLYINDLPSRVKSQARLFADDCLLYRPISSIEDQVLLQKDLESLDSWADTWGMRFNAQKCYIMRISRSRTPHTFNYSLCGHVLEQVQTIPYLGVTFSEDLSWSPHIDKITGKSNRTLGFLRRNLKACPQKLKATAYFSLIRSTIEYCSTIWDPFTVKNIKALEKIQRRSARFVCGDYGRRSSVTAMMEKLEWKPLVERRRDARLTMFYKLVNDLVAVPSSQYLEKGYTRTRSSNSQKYRQYQCDTENFRNSFVPRTIPDWSKLPDSVVSSQTLELFKCRLRGSESQD